MYSIMSFSAWLTCEHTKCLSTCMLVTCNAFELSQISDEKEHMLYANVAAEKLLGFSREDEDAALWDEGGHATGDESGGICDSAAVVSALSFLIKVYRVSHPMRASRFFG